MTKSTPVRVPVVGSAALGAVVFGTVVGGAAAAAGIIRKVKSGDISRQQATKEVVREAGTIGIASGTAVAVMGALGLGGILSLAGIVAVATGTKYALDSVLKPVPVVSPVGAKKSKSKTPAKPKAAVKAAKKVKDETKKETKPTTKVQ